MNKLKVEMIMNDIECNHCYECNLDFSRKSLYLNHIRWKHVKKYSICQYCNKEIKCGLKKHELACELNPDNVRYCLQCNKVLKRNQYKFCNCVCSGLYNNKYLNIDRRPKYRICECKLCHQYTVTNDRVLDEYVLCNNCRLKINFENYQSIHEQEKKRIYLIDQKCIICNTVFHHSSFRKTCGNECFSKLFSNLNTLNINCGGETNYKKFRYKDILMDSSWEVIVAKYMDQHNIKWQRTKKICFLWQDEINQKRRRYHPDFYLPDYNIYIDTKNAYLIEKDKYKINQVLKEHNIRLIIGDEKQIISILEILLTDGSIAQLVERELCKLEVSGSIPDASI